MRNEKEQSVDMSQKEANEPEVVQTDGEYIAKMRTARKCKVSQLTRRMNIIKELMKDNQNR